MRRQESIKAVPWQDSAAPKAVLVMRFHAMGDVVITMPYLQDLRQKLPTSTRLHLLTRQGDNRIPASLELFDEIHTYSGTFNRYQSAWTLLKVLPTLRKYRFDVIIDLQRSTRSTAIRRLLRPRAWSQIERFSPTPAGHKFQRGIEASGLVAHSALCTQLAAKGTDAISANLHKAGWDGQSPLVVLNPAGFYASRHWPIDNYISFARLWRAQVQPGARFLVVGVERLSAKAATLSAALGELVINLVGQTKPEEAFQLMAKASLVLTEDGGLMHMAWVNGTPTLALFGSSRHDWSAPQGPHSHTLHSGDLACGACMLPICKYGDNRCLTRYSPQQVVDEASALLDRLQKL